MMNRVIELFVFSCISGISVVIGGFLGTKKMTDKMLAFTLAFGSGVLLSVVSFSLMHEAYRKSGPIFVSLAFFAGGVVFYFAEKLLAKAVTEGIGMLLGTALDDLPETLSMGIGFASNTGQLGIVLALSIFLHNIPEGISSTNDLVDEGGISPRTALLMALVVALLNPAVAFAGYFFLRDIKDAYMGLVLAFSGGSILFMTGTDMIPKAHRLGTKAENFGLIVGFLAGFLISRLV